MKNRLINLKRVNGPAFDSILLALIQVITYGTNIITTKILSIELSLTEYGTYSTVNTVITIAASLTLFGLGDSVNYYYNKKESEKAESRTEYINTIFFIQLCVGVGVGLILLLGSALISDYYNNPAVKPLLWFVCLKPWISNATHLYQVLFVSCGKSKLIAVRNLVISVLKVILMCIAVKVFNSLSAIFICLVALEVVQLIAFKIIFGKTAFPIRVFAFCREKLLPVIKYTIPMGVYFVTITLMREVDKLVIGRFGTTEELAIYANCAKTLPVNILITSFATVLIPYIMKNVSGKNYSLTAHILREYLSVGYLSVWMLSGALLLCAPEAIQFFYSGEYVVGLPIFVLYVIDGMVQFASVHLVIAANGDSKYLMKTSVSLLTLNAILSVILYKSFAAFNEALLGPAVATVIVSVLYVLILYRKTAKILQAKIVDFVPLGKMARYLCELLIFGMVFYIGKQAMKNWNVPWVVIMISVCVFYCLAVILTKWKECKALFLEINRLKQTELQRSKNDSFV